jgi:NAD(P)-dependent dehydrogenase (short-subunit alcohol dehydrogenase family)
MEEKDWDLVNLIHVKGCYSTIKAAWPYMRDQNYGRIVNVTSTSGLFGNFGQSNYSAAKVSSLLAVASHHEPHSLLEDGSRWLFVHSR